MSKSSRKSGSTSRRVRRRGATPLGFEPLEGRQLLSTGTATTVSSAATTTVLPDLVQTGLQTPTTLNWGDTFQVSGSVQNQGTVPVSNLASIDIYASTSSTVDANSVLVGSISIPNGLGVGKSYSYNQSMQLPINGIPGVNSNQVWLNARVDLGTAAGPDRTTPPLGQGLDQSLVTIAPKALANLVPTVFQVNPDVSAWGGSVSLLANITNNGQGNSPATLASIILTPSGNQPGMGTDYAIGQVNVPAIAVGQTATVTQTVNLPSGIPKVLSGSNQFIMSIVPDTNYTTTTWYPRIPQQGVGYDQANLEIDAKSGSGTAATTTQTNLPHLEVASVQAPSLPQTWGQSFQVSAVLQNLGKADAGQTRVDFALVDRSLNANQAIYLGSTTINQLGAGTSQAISQTITLPSELPDGSTPPQVTQGIIAVVIDPLHAVNQTTYANNANYSPTVTLTTLTPSQVQAALASSNTTATTTSTTSTTTTTTTTAPVSQKAARAVRRQEVLAELKVKQEIRAANLAEVHAQAQATRAAYRFHRAPLRIYRSNAQLTLGKSTNKHV